jgi:hypothetical protein
VRNEVSHVAKPSIIKAWNLGLRHACKAWNRFYLLGYHQHMLSTVQFTNDTFQPMFHQEGEVPDAQELSQHR